MSRLFLSVWRNLCAFFLVFDAFAPALWSDGNTCNVLPHHGKRPTECTKKYSIRTVSVDTIVTSVCYFCGRVHKQLNELFVAGLGHNCIKCKTVICSTVCISQIQILAGLCERSGVIYQSGMLFWILSDSAILSNSVMAAASQDSRI